MATLAGDGTAPATVSMGTATPKVTGGDLGTVDISGVGTVNLSNVARAITADGIAAVPDAFVVNPLTSSSAAIQDDGLNPVVNATTTGTLTINPLGGGDSVTVNGTAASDTIAVARNAVTDTVQVNAPWNRSASPQPTRRAMVVASRADRQRRGRHDQCHRRQAAHVQRLRRPDAGQRHAQRDQLGDFRRDQRDARRHRQRGEDRQYRRTISFAGMKRVNLTDTTAAGDPLNVIGTNGNDAISAAFAGGTNLAWVNGQAPSSFTGFSVLTLNGQFGNDTFNVAHRGHRHGGPHAGDQRQRRGRRRPADRHGQPRPTRSTTRRAVPRRGLSRSPARSR